ncbi:trehalose-phosphatase [Brevibacterium sp. FME37]|uniref:trehalose-phosphatase n=1 Tax=Brevibacterium sp. FME37 TaxID=2742607 RepID=UPI0018661E9A|nr:trehalose-phosphatase [Brevibacterium sp. FME37]
MTSDPDAMPPSQTRPGQSHPEQNPPGRTEPEQAPSSEVVPTPRSTPGYTSAAALDLEQATKAESVLIALDFDGVLAPLQDNPELSRMLPESAQAIIALSLLPATRVALVSGRDVATLRRLVDPPPGVWLVGSHGAEVDLGSQSPEVTVTQPEVSAEEQQMLTAIDAHIESFELDLSSGSGSAPDTDTDTEVRVEYKPFSRTVHTRGLDAEFASALHAHVIAVQTEYPGIRVIEGHDITELAVKTATKGDGLRALIAVGSPTAVLYLGDDVTDEDAFAELEDLSTSLSIKVGPAPTRAPWRITDPNAVAELLTRIVNERRAHQPRP